MTLARVRRPTWAARPAAWKASPSTYTPPWKYKTTWRGSMPSTVISAVGTAPSAAAVTVTSAGGGARGKLPYEPPLLGDVAADREGRLSQDCFEVLSLLGAHGALPSVGLAGHRQHC